MYELVFTIKLKSILQGDTIKRRLLFALSKFPITEQPIVDFTEKEVDE
jgi:hypothetical protein